MPRDKWKCKYNIPKSKGYRKSSSNREVHSNTGQHQESRKIPNKKNLTLHLKELENKEKIKPKANRKKEIKNVRAEINKRETNKTVEKNEKSMRAGPLKR